MMDELQRELEDEVDDEGYTIEKTLILDAWKRFRPVNKADDDEGDGVS